MNNKGTLDTLSADINKIIIESESFTEQISSKETKYLQILTQKKQKKKQVSPVIIQPEIQNQTINKPNNFHEAYELAFKKAQSNKDKFIAYLKSFKTLYDEENKIDVFVDGNSEQNDTFETSLKSDILIKWSPSSKLRDFLKDCHSKTLKELIKFLITVPDDDTKGKNDEFLTANLILFNSIISNKFLPDYNLLQNRLLYGPLYDTIKPRFETKFSAYTKNRINSNSFFNLVKSYFKIEQQVCIEGKFYDFCIAIKQGDAYVIKLMVEVQENGGNHEYSQNDIDKKLIAVRNHKEIVYFRKAAYEQDNGNNMTNYINEFWHGSPDKEGIFKHGFEDYLTALLLNADIYCRRKYLELEFINAKTKLDKFEKQLDEEEDEQILEKINEEIIKLNIDIASANNMLQIFDWKELSQKSKKGDIIDLDAVFKMTEIIDDINLRQNIIREYNIKNNKIDWKVMMYIISIYCKDITLKTKLMSYLIKVEDKYEEILGFKDKYQNFKDDLSEWFHKYQKELQDSKHNKELDKVKHELSHAKSINDTNESIWTRFLNETINYKNMHNKYDVAYSPDDSSIEETFDDKLKEMIKFDKNKNNYIKNKFERKVKDFTFSFNFTEDDARAFSNRPDIKINFSRNTPNTIKYSDFRAYCLQRGIQPTVCEQYITIIYPQANLADHTEIPFLYFV